MSSHPTLQNIPSTRKPNLAVTPPMRKLLHVIFVLIAVLGANSIYLAGITLIGWGTGQSYENFFYLCMFGLHLVLGVLFLAPFLIFGVWHMLAARKRRNRRAVKIGYALFAMSIILLSSGILLVRIPGLIELKHHFTRSTAYWAHVLCPLVCIWLYWLHRLAGPRIKWKVGFGYLGVVGVVVGAMLILQAQDPRGWNRPGSKEGKKYFEPSLVSTPKGEFIAERALMNDDYCLQCHQDAYQGWFHSAHHFSSFNNPAYLASIKETRKVIFERDGDVKASRWCAGCHDPVPFFTGAFDDPNYDFINDKTAHAGITCTVCHGITHIGDHALGNANYVIEEPIHYPFAYSDSQLLQAINNTLVKAKPEFHKKSMLKPFHKEAEFCAVCHKVH
ncbi:MAG: cytochrome c family protein, partial [Pirellulaceae bacterium]|nr:cytochrome c family protein [Pirellulaceae bacterium]